MEAKRILVIDDEVLICRALADFLATLGYVTTIAHDGQQGLEHIRHERFDAILVDLRMPKMDGITLVGVLKDEQPELPVVVISASGVLSDAIEALRQGAWDYITKPIRDIDEVGLVIERVLEKAQLRAERDRYQRELEALNRSLEAEVSRQVQDLRAQNRELAALNRVSYAISDPLDLDTMLHRAVSAAMAAVEADGGVVWLLNPAIERLVVAAVRGLPKSYRASAPAIPLGQGVVGQVAQSGHPRAGYDVDSDPLITSLSADNAVGAYVCVPLRAGDVIVGTLLMLWQDRQDLARGIELLATIGNQIGVAVARAQYAADLERANVELRRLDKLREQFVQNVAHELRTPLAIVHEYIEMLGNNGVDVDEKHKALDVTARRVRSLVDLVESITTLQDIDREPLHIQKINLAELTKTALRMCWQRAMGEGIALRNLSAPDLPAIQGDFARLSQALYQLLDNACKFSSAGSTVTIAAQAAQDTVSISISDEGIGISAEEQARIFDVFYQIDGGTSRRYSGTGLGLAIVKETVKAHGGCVTVKSKVGQGSVFTIRLPCHPIRNSLA